MKKTIFVCPTCKKPLVGDNNRFLCESGHSYDLARQGYLHLLPANKMHSKIPGDTGEMVAARRAFLETGYYDIFIAELLRLFKKYPCPLLLDAGCGEGYYAASLKKAFPHMEIFGFDISKAAVKAAAGKYKELSFAVASMFHIPVSDACCDGVLNIFAPLVESEILRVLKPNGLFIFAVPGKRHLWQMKEILYEIPYENEEKIEEYPGLTLLDRVPVAGKIFLPNGEVLWNLFSMTPYLWKTSKEGCQRLRATQSLTTEIEFDFLVYQKKK